MYLKFDCNSVTLNPVYFPYRIYDICDVHLYHGKATPTTLPIKLVCRDDNSKWSLVVTLPAMSHFTHYSPFSPPFSHLPGSPTPHLLTSQCLASYGTSQSVALAWGFSAPLDGSGRCSHLPRSEDMPRCGLSGSYEHICAVDKRPVT